MEKSIRNWQLAGFFFTVIAGVIMHFVFDWTGQNAIVALVAPVNESIWEHIKLLFFPILLFAWMEYRVWGKEYEQFWCIKLRGILLGSVLIPIIYYTYNGIFGKSADWINIVIFVVAVGISYLVETKLFQIVTECSLNPERALKFLFAVGILFMVLTFFTPRIPFFQDPVTGTYAPAV